MASGGGTQVADRRRIVLEDYAKRLKEYTEIESRLKQRE